LNELARLESANPARPFASYIAVNHSCLLYYSHSSLFFAANRVWHPLTKKVYNSIKELAYQPKADVWIMLKAWMSRLQAWRRKY